MIFRITICCQSYFCSGFLISHCAISSLSNLTIAVIYPVSWALTGLAFLIYYKTRKWMPRGFHF